ncbi:IS3 family transposase [Saccharothrix sp. BKS2]|uniref:IS3 family transposase n=1 Tax=Saccharothrix sp. BKS2 TaxID=3064400 RepID=UPI0039EAA753
MSKPCPRGFRGDVVRVARDREPGVTVERIAKDFGVRPMTLFKWLRQADADEGVEPGVGGLAADGVLVSVTCRVLDIARRPYHRWRARPVTGTELDQAYRANALFDAHRDDPEFGYRFPADEARDVGLSMADRTAWRICPSMGWWSAFGRKRGRDGKKAGPPVHDDLVRRGFTATAPNRLWPAGITGHRTAEGKPYLCAVKDVRSNRIVGYSIDSRMKSRLAVAAPTNAVARRGDVAGRVVRTDRGSQSRSRKFVRALARHGLTGSMGRIGAAGDDTATESFFALPRNNVPDRRTWSTRGELRTAIATWIERTYHRRRRQTGLGRLTPIEYEAIMTTSASQTA